MSAAQPDIKIGDIVTRSAKGKQFVVTDFWTAPYGEPMASLMPIRGYTGASAAVTQLTLVERPAGAS